MVVRVLLVQSGLRVRPNQLRALLLCHRSCEAMSRERESSQNRLYHDNMAMQIAHLSQLVRTRDNQLCVERSGATWLRARNANLQERNDQLFEHLLIANQHVLDARSQITRLLDELVALGARASGDDDVRVTDGSISGTPLAHNDDAFVASGALGGGCALSASVADSSGPASHRDRTRRTVQSPSATPVATAYDRSLDGVPVVGHRPRVSFPVRERSRSRARRLNFALLAQLRREASSSA